MKKIQVLIFPITIILLMFLIENKNTGTLYLDFCEAKNTSLIEKKPLLIIFDNKSKQEISTIKNIKDYVVCFLDYEENKKIIEEYKINKIPSYVIIDNITNSVYKEEGYKNKNKLIEWLFQIKQKIKSDH